MSGSESVDPEWKGLYRAGGIGWIIVGVLYFVEIPLFFLLASSLSGGDVALKNLAGQALIAQITIGLAIVSHLFSIPGILAFYHVLKRVNKNAMLVAAAFLSLYLVLDMAVATPNFISLITLSQNYVAATSDVQRTAYSVVANYAFSLFSTSTPVYGSLIPSIGILITGLVMMKGIFKKGVAISAQSPVLLVLLPVSDFLRQHWPFSMLRTWCFSESGSYSSAGNLFSLADDDPGSADYSRGQSLVETLGSLNDGTVVLTADLWH